MKPNALGEYDEKLNRYLRLNTFPVAVRFLRRWDEMPDRSKRPVKDLGNRLTTCQAIRMARRFDWVIALGREESVPRLPEGKYVGVAVAPLERTSFEPDSIVIYANSAKVMRLSQAYLWKRGGTLKSEFRGRIDCADIAIAPVITGEPQMIVPCSGERIFGQVPDHELAFGFPFSLMDEIVQGLEEIHKAGTRNPVTNWLSYTAAFPPSYDEYRKVLDQSGPPSRD